MKEYVKPDLYYEEFVLATHIAACGFQFTMNEGECTATNGIFELFGENCLDNADGYEGYCYNTGADGFNTFGS